jgi:uncharacterized membrane protein YgcG
MQQRMHAAKNRMAMIKHRIKEHHAGKRPLAEYMAPEPEAAPAEVGKTKHKKPAKTKAEKKAKKKGFFKKLGAKVKKLGKFVLKAATVTQRLAIKGMIEVIFPQIAPLFLYLFIPEEQVSKMPEKVQKKRAKQEKFKKFITNVIGMKEAHFMGIMRNGITKRAKRSPESLLQAMYKGKIAGIGFIQFVVLIPKVIKLIGKIAKLFKKKPADDEALGADDAPHDSDFHDMSPSDANQAAAELKETSPSPTAVDQAEGTAHGDMSNPAGTDDSGSGSSGGGGGTGSGAGGADAGTGADDYDSAGGQKHAPGMSK